MYTYVTVMSQSACWSDLWLYSKALSLNDKNNQWMAPKVQNISSCVKKLYNNLNYHHLKLQECHNRKPPLLMAPETATTVTGEV